MATSGWSRPYARSLIASARSSMSRVFAWSPKAPYAAPRFVQRDGHFRVVAAVRPLLDRERALQHVALLRQCRLARTRDPEVHSAVATSVWSLRTSARISGSARSSTSRCLA